MSQNTILLLQSLLIFLQVVNGAIGTLTHNATIAVLVGAFVGSLQYYVQHIGNASIPPPAVPETTPNPPAK
jgi:hypothetical protein